MNLRARLGNAARRVVGAVRSGVNRLRGRRSGNSSY